MLKAISGTTNASALTMQWLFSFIVRFLWIGECKPLRNCLACACTKSSTKTGSIFPQCWTGLLRLCCPLVLALKSLVPKALLAIAFNKIASESR